MYVPVCVYLCIFLLLCLSDSFNGMGRGAASVAREVHMYKCPVVRNLGKENARKFVTDVTSVLEYGIVAETP